MVGAAAGGDLAHQFADLEDGYGFLLECPTTDRVGGGGRAVGVGRQHKEFMLECPRTASFINLTRDRGHGRVGIDEAGNAVASTRWPTSSTCATSAAGSTRWRGCTRRRARGGSSRWPQAARYWSGARTSTRSRTRSGGCRWRRASTRSSRPTRWAAAGWAPTSTRVAGPWGELHDVARRVDRGRERVPDRVGGEPDDHDHGAGAPDRGDDRRGLTATRRSTRRWAAFRGLDAVGEVA